jgi:Tol biopolymer transport system component
MSGDRNVWIYDISRHSLNRLTSERRNARAIWTPDGKRVVFGSADGGDEICSAASRRQRRGERSPRATARTTGDVDA